METPDVSFDGAQKWRKSRKDPDVMIKIFDDSIKPAAKNTYSRLTLELPVEGLETERFLLRPMTPLDVDVILEMDMDPEVMKHFPEMPIDEEQHAANFVEDIQNEERYKFFYLIENKENKRGLGWVFIRPTEDGQWIELGYRLCRQFWGQNVVPEASKKMLDYAFNVWQSHAVLALIVAQNHPSLRVAEKLGLILIGEGDFYQSLHQMHAIKNPYTVSYNSNN